MHNKNDSNNHLLEIIEELLHNYKVDNIVNIPLDNKSIFFDNAFIATGRSSMQIKSIAKNICDTLKTKYNLSTNMEGYIKGEWVLIDCGAIMINLFLKDVRSKYDLESFWEYSQQKC